MILLDTNVVSALMRPAVDPRIEAWLARLTQEALATSAITLMEVRYGLARLPEGKRRTDLAARFEDLIMPGGGFTILPFDELAAKSAGDFMALRESLGQPGGATDMMIAGVAASAGAALATRNVRDFEGLPLSLIDPWNA